MDPPPETPTTPTRASASFASPSGPITGARRDRRFRAGEARSAERQIAIVWPRTTSRRNCRLFRPACQNEPTAHPSPRSIDPTGIGSSMRLAGAKTGGSFSRSSGEKQGCVGPCECTSTSVPFRSKAFCNASPLNFADHESTEPCALRSISGSGTGSHSRASRSKCPGSSLTEQMRKPASSPRLKFSTCSSTSANMFASTRTSKDGVSFRSIDPAEPWKAVRPPRRRQPQSEIRARRFTVGARCRSASASAGRPARGRHRSMGTGS